MGTCNGQERIISRRGSRERDIRSRIYRWGIISKETRARAIGGRMYGKGGSRKRVINIRKSRVLIGWCNVSLRGDRYNRNWVLKVRGRYIIRRMQVGNRWSIIMGKFRSNISNIFTRKRSNSKSVTSRTIQGALRYRWRLLTTRTLNLGREAHRASAGRYMINRS
jgi:hypothetical protein